MAEKQTRGKKLQEVEKIIDESKPFTLLKLEIAKGVTKISPMTQRTRLMLTAINIGISPKTAMLLCKITPTQFEVWLKDPANHNAFDEALAVAEAYLEFIVYNTAPFNPGLALSLLKERDPKRWKSQKPEEIEDPKEKFANAAKEVVKARLTMSEMIEGKEIPSINLENNDGSTGSDVLQ